MELRFIAPLLLVLLSHACIFGVLAVRFDMDAYETKCFSEELNLNALVLANYRVISENAPKISVRVNSPHGSILHFRENVSEGGFGYTTKEAGNFLACFWMPMASKGTKISVELDWKTGVAAKDWASIAKREKIDGMQLELRKLEDAVQEIHDEMLYLRERELEMRNLNETTNSRMAWFTISSLCICLLVAGLQLWHLKTFFEKKKII